MSAQRRAAVVAEAHALLGIHEIPPHSNFGPDVHRLQSATGAYGAPWCVSTIQYIWRQVLGSTWASATANAYRLAEYAHTHGAVIPRPVAGCAVVYHVGAGHAGTVVNAAKVGSIFAAVEGNEADAVRQVTRDSQHIPCTFILRPELR